jgi:hypothetical protein
LEYLKCLHGGAAEVEKDVNIRWKAASCGEAVQPYNEDVL